MSSGGNLAQSVAERLADQIQVSSMLVSLNNCFSMHFLQAIYDESLFDICLVCEYASMLVILVVCYPVRYFCEPYTYLTALACISLSHLV